jgi:hypothetical protein
MFGSPSGVSFSPENEQSELPLLMLLFGGEGVFPVGGGPLISPANTGAAVIAAPIKMPLARINLVIARLLHCECSRVELAWLMCDDRLLMII